MASVRAETIRTKRHTGASMLTMKTMKELRAKIG